jgi:hypothetical protein
MYVIILLLIDLAMSVYLKRMDAFDAVSINEACNPESPRWSTHMTFWGLCHTQIKMFTSNFTVN